ncbi:MAG: gonadoliberin III [Porticoccaceae bacterium]|nr:MAG: gonadoliberin III [Porticoccaceae bacterium]
MSAGRCGRATPPRGPQTLYYKLEVTEDLDAAGAPPVEPPPAPPEPPLWSPAEAVAAQSLIAAARELSADPASFAQQLLLMMTGEAVSQDAEFLFRASHNTSTAELALRLFATAGIPARMVRGIYLADRLYNVDPAELVEIWDGRQWLAVDPRDASLGVPDDFFVWQRGGVSLLDVVGGRQSRVRFSVLANDLSAKAVALQAANSERVALVDFSIYSLPIDKQTTFKILLLVPIGALVVAVFRILVGIKTSGTFMPVLIALAFIHTRLLPGILILVTLLAAGLWVRFYLSKLDLLMVARLAAVVITVVLLMAGFSILSYKLGLEEVLTITFFPMIIIAWTIERLSITWEEDGPREVFTQGLGSLFVAVVAYLVMTNRYVEHLTYNFPETLLIVMGLVLVLGQYTGYRLTELRRFRFLIET